jgi:hypothetical protein
MRGLGSKPRDLTPKGTEAAREGRLSSCNNKVGPVPQANCDTVSRRNVAAPGTKCPARQIVATPVALEALRASGDIRLIPEALAPYPKALVIATKGGWNRPERNQCTQNAIPKYHRRALNAAHCHLPRADSTLRTIIVKSSSNVSRPEKLVTAW